MQSSQLFQIFSISTDNATAARWRYTENGVAESGFQPKSSNFKSILPVCRRRRWWWWRSWWWSDENRIRSTIWGLNTWELLLVTQLIISRKICKRRSQWGGTSQSNRLTLPASSQSFFLSLTSLLLLFSFTFYSMLLPGWKYLLEKLQCVFRYCRRKKIQLNDEELESQRNMRHKFVMTPGFLWSDQD